MTNETEAVRAEPAAWLDDSGVSWTTRRYAVMFSNGEPRPLYPASEIARLTGEVSRLQKSLDKLTGMKFSDRMHAALVSRAEVAEAELTKFRKDAGRWHFFLLCFDRPMEREWLRCGFNLPPRDFTPDISAVVDAAMRHNLKPWQMRLYGMIAEELTQPEADHV